MSDEPRDPFVDDEDAERERRRRRAEREQRRRERLTRETEGRRRATLAERVRERLVERPERSASAAQSPAPTARSTPPAVERPKPATADLPAAGRDGRPPPSAVSRPPASTAAGGPGGPPVWRRRLGALVALGALAVLVLGLVEAAQRLSGEAEAPVPPKEPKTTSVTIPEGLTREQIAETASEAGVQGDYEQASKSSKAIDLGEYGAKSADSLEGFLFPATYELTPRDDAEELVSQQLDAFRQNIRRVDLGYARSKNLTTYDVLIIASMIEREVQVPAERAKVAAVIYNRLSQGMPLGIDATIRYATGNYDQPLTESELAIDSAYNTRTNSGLPPGPIGNPGLDSIEAAAKPAQADYLYYVVKPGTCGEHLFTASSAEFDQAAARYQQALEAEGNSPTEC